jgi:hypothetical protein
MDDMTSPPKFIGSRPYAKPEDASAKLVEIAKALRVDRGRMPIGEWNGTFLKAGGSVAEYSVGRDRLIAHAVIVMHECGSMFMWKTPSIEEMAV